MRRNKKRMRFNSGEKRERKMKKEKK